MKTRLMKTQPLTHKPRTSQVQQRMMRRKRAHVQATKRNLTASPSLKLEQVRSPRRFFYHYEHPLRIMSTVQLAQIKTDTKTSAIQSELRIGNLRIPLPNRFPISPERNALKPAGVKDPLPGEVAVLARLAPPETGKKILTQEDALKSK